MKKISNISKILPEIDDSQANYAQEIKPLKKFLKIGPDVKLGKVAKNVKLQNLSDITEEEPLTIVERTIPNIANQVKALDKQSIGGTEVEKLGYTISINNQLSNHNFDGAKALRNLAVSKNIELPAQVTERIQSLEPVETRLRLPEEENREAQIQYIRNKVVNEEDARKLLDNLSSLSPLEQELVKAAIRPIKSLLPGPDDIETLSVSIPHGVKKINIKVPKAISDLHSEDAEQAYTRLALTNPFSNNIGKLNKAFKSVYGTAPFKAGNVGHNAESAILLAKGDYAGVYNLIVNAVSGNLGLFETSSSSSLPATPVKPARQTSSGSSTTARKKKHGGELPKRNYQYKSETSKASYKPSMDVNRAFNRMEILLGEIQLGNDSKQMKNELSDILDYLLLHKEISKSQVMEILNKIF